MYEEITLQLTTECNLRCPYCFAQKMSGELITDRNFDVFEQFCKKNKPDCIHITGGEPTLHPMFVEIVSRLSKICSLVIYSNLTIPETIEKIQSEHPAEIVFLLNLNERNSYSELHWKQMQRNVTAIKRKGMRLAVSHTFYKDTFEQDIRFILSYMIDHELDHFRLSQAVGNNQNIMGLDRNQIKKLYKLVADNIETWKDYGIKVYFDCPVPPCFVDKIVYDKLKRFEAVGSHCIPKAFVMWNLSVTHCYSTIGCGNIKYLYEYNDIESIKRHSENLLYNKTKNQKRNCALCNNYNAQYTCGCPEYWE